MEEPKLRMKTKLCIRNMRRKSEASPRLDPDGGMGSANEASEMREWMWGKWGKGRARRERARVPDEEGQESLGERVTREGRRGWALEEKYWKDSRRRRRRISAFGPSGYKVQPPARTPRPGTSSPMWPIYRQISKIFTFLKCVLNNPLIHFRPRLAPARNRSVWAGGSGAASGRRGLLAWTFLFLSFLFFVFFFFF